MPIQRRLPKVGFTSRSKPYKAEIRLNELALVAVDVVDLEALKQCGVLPGYIKQAKVINSGSIEKSVTIQGLAFTAGAKAAIEAAGGKVEN